LAKVRFFKGKWAEGLILLPIALIMIIFHEAETIREYLLQQRKTGLKLGFVPTMGALHQGHLALLRQSLDAGDFSIVSIFVNPTQFNDPSDYEKYPVTIEEDIQLLEANGCHMLFLPAASEIYPNGTELSQPFDLGALEQSLEGRYRPGHFQGVCQVMDRLLDLVQPDHLYMGLKDYQQCQVVKRLLILTERDQHILFIPCPTLRETDGLAMSSRNRRLPAADREKATLIFQTLQSIKKNLQPGAVEEQLLPYRQQLANAGFRPDYLALADARTLEEIQQWNGRQEAIILVAAFLGEVRLIDNMEVLSFKL
jgi:pantoate--beta-alanine ligase